MDQSVEIKFTVEQLNTVLNGLGQMPYIQAAPVIGYIQQLAEKQLSKEGANENT